MQKVVTILGEADLASYTLDLIQHIESETSGKEAVIVTLSGDLGAGKTALVKALGGALGVKEVIVSPTFVVLKTYETLHPHFTHLVHMDAYRIESTSELAPLHFLEYTHEPNTLVCIEWPECIPDALTMPHHHIAITIMDETKRTLTYTHVKN
ncbi:MAG: hypothetical protein RLZZ70_241 [Candidatus Parcubacteria bacterium]|jgi:tRNA threonylcarbamoyladenosine biosynthesis protein TsaE